MVTYISEPGSFLGVDLLTKNTSLKELQKNLQRLLDDGKDMTKLELMNRKFKPIRSRVRQMTSDCVMFEWNRDQFRYRSILLEGAL